MCYPLSTRQCLVLVLAPTLSSTQAELQSPASHPLHRAACTGETGGEVVRSSLLWPHLHGDTRALPAPVGALPAAACALQRRAWQAYKPSTKMLSN